MKNKLLIIFCSFLMIANAQETKELPKTKEGDIMVIKNAGAYGFSMASNYNSRFRPAEVLIYEGKPHLIRKRETMEDILKNQVVIDL